MVVAGAHSKEIDIVWGTLIHEMLHAYLTIVTGSHWKAKEVCTCGTDVSHGPMWLETVGLLVQRLDFPGIRSESIADFVGRCHGNDIELVDF